MDTPSKQKVCNFCKISKPVSEFGPTKQNLDGLKGQCKSCLKAKYKEYCDKHPERRKASANGYYERSIEGKFDQSSKNRKLARENGQETYIGKPCVHCGNRIRQTKNSNCRPCRLRISKEPKAREAVDKWNKRNPEKRRETWARRRARKYGHEAFPLTDMQKKEILEIYKNCPDGYQVDHIIPLMGKDFSGLHVPWNLQYLTIEENQKKGNRI